MSNLPEEATLDQRSNCRPEVHSPHPRILPSPNERDAEARYNGNVSLRTHGSDGNQVEADVCQATLSSGAIRYGISHIQPHSSLSTPLLRS